MKTKIKTAALSAMALVAFANEPSAVQTLSDLPLDRKASFNVDTTASKSGFSYFRFAAADAYPTDSVQVVPGLGVGYRLATGNGALDLSANYSSGKGWTGESKNLFWTLPKVSYLRYWNAASDQSAYGGLGLAWGGIQTKDDREFQGIIPSATVGVEFFRKSAVRTFAELNVSQPAVARVVSDIFPGPIAEFSIGAGF